MSRPKPQSQPQHAPEPWRYLTNEGDTRAIISDFNGPPGTWLMECRNTYGSEKFEPNIRRIVACINACAGIPTAALEGNGNALSHAIAHLEHVAETDMPRYALTDEASKILARLRGQSSPTRQSEKEQQA